MPQDGMDFVPHSEILTYEEMLKVVKVAAGHGVRKVRVTGGEPLVRRDLIPFLRNLATVEGLEEITLTTNGVLLDNYAGQLKEAGIKRINISLDTLKADRFLKITGRDYFHKVVSGIMAAEEAGLNPIKINVVVMRGVNDDELLDFVSLAQKGPVHVRFIEYMPVGRKNGWRPEEFVAIAEMKDVIGKELRLLPVKPGKLDGPALRFRPDGWPGEIGFIGALSNHFCDRCNRLRLTAEGRLRSCLFSDREIDIKGPLRQGADEETVLRLLRLSAETKPRNHMILQRGPRKCARLMSSIGG
jgi:cyclic pyranopterin phosphate synthase